MQWVWIVALLVNVVVGGGCLMFSMFAVMWGCSADFWLGIIWYR